MTDETFSLVSTKEIPKGVDESRFFFFLSLFNHIYWITGCALGGIIGTAIPLITRVLILL
jgi:4-azaleucine resistance transporter AzlC